MQEKKPKTSLILLYAATAVSSIILTTVALYISFNLGVIPHFRPISDEQIATITEKFRSRHEEKYVHTGYIEKLFDIPADARFIKIVIQTPDRNNAGYYYPGCLVDVLKKEEGGQYSKPTMTMLLHDIRVIAISGTYNHDSSSTAFVLMVNPEQVEEIEKAKETGTIDLYNLEYPAMI